MAEQTTLYQEFECMSVATADAAFPAPRPERKQRYREIASAIKPLAVETFEGHSQHLSVHEKPTARTRPGVRQNKSVVLKLEGGAEIPNLGEFLERLNALLATLTKSPLRFVRASDDPKPAP
jgi:hypothetical protein